MSTDVIDFGLHINDHQPFTSTLDDLLVSTTPHLNLSGNASKGNSRPAHLPELNLKDTVFDYDKHVNSPASSSAVSIRSSVSLVQPTSSYWHIPDSETHLTAITAHENNRLCAIGSGSKSNNLFIYEVYPDGIMHHQTVTLPEISTLQWASPRTQLGQMGNVLISGHRSGVAHLTLLPDADAQVGDKAEILKRYNHVKHLSPLATNSSARHRSVRIKNLELTSPSWQCCIPLSLLTLCGDHIFLWEPNRSDVPLVMQKAPGTNTLGMCGSRDGIYALGRKKGVCIRDIRVRDRINSGLKPPVENDESVSIVKWNPFDGGNQLAAVHDRTTIKIWDIRHKKPIATYNRHLDSITGLEWSTGSELVSASADGTVRVWDTNNEQLKTATTTSSTTAPNSGDLYNDGYESPVGTPWNDYRRRLSMDRELEGRTDDLLHSIPPVNHSRQFSAMALTSMGPSIGALTIDTSGYLGVHDLADAASYPHLSTSSLDLMGNGSFSP